MNKSSIRLFDAHCDTASALHFQQRSLYENPGHTDVKRGLAYKAYAQFYAVFTTEEEKYTTYREIWQTMKQELARHRDKTVFCTCRADAERAEAEGKTAAFFTIEGSDLLRGEISLLEEAAAEGLAAVNLTWNFETAVSGSNAEGKNKGLTHRGVDFVRRCNDLGVLVDVSHLSDPGFYDVLAVTQKPVIASHSNARALCGHSRNLTDKMFRALMENGGVTGLNVYSAFLGGTNDIDCACGHILHFLDMGGEKNIGIGCDFDGCDALPQGIEGLQSMDKLYNALLSKNIPQATVDDIFYNNFMNLLR